MKVDISPRKLIHRHSPVEGGNVYSNAHARFFRIIIAIVPDTIRKRNWNNVVCIHVDATGEIVGTSMQPMLYIKEHQDLCGKIVDMPSMKVEWFDENNSNP